MPSIVSHATAADGTDLLVRHWPPDEVEAGGAWAGKPWASILLVHGLGEQSGRYEHVGDQFASAGLDAWAYDQRGNGGSGGRRGDIERWSQFHDDLGERLAAVRGGAGGRPVVVYGHSMGGLVVAGYLLSDRPRPDLVVLGSPGLDSALPGWKKSVSRVLARVTPTLPIPNGIDGSTLSRDRDGRREGRRRPPGTRRPARPGSVPRDSPSRLAFERAPRPVSASRRWSCTASTTAWSHRRRPRSSKAPQASSAARSRASATSSTTNPRAPRSSTT